MPEPTPCKLIRLTPYPPGGFPFSEVVNGIERKIPCIGLDFASQAREILKFRRGNRLPRATFEECFEDLNVLPANWLRPKLLLGWHALNSKRRAGPGFQMRLVWCQGMTNALTDWLGAGGTPVARDAAEYRARICLTCPLNVAPGWWDRNLKDPIAEMIRAGLEVKSGMSLHLDCEDGLHMCRACGCCARLKVWTPIQHILNHTDETTMNKFDANCWIIQNLK